jgi:hypothetical protein
MNLSAVSVLATYDTEHSAYSLRSLVVTSCQTHPGLENKNTEYANRYGNFLLCCILDVNLPEIFFCLTLLSGSGLLDGSGRRLGVVIRCAHTLNQFCPSQLSSDYYKWSQSSSNETSHSKSFQRTVSAQVNKLLKRAEP